MVSLTPRYDFEKLILSDNDVSINLIKLLSGDIIEK